MIVIVGIHKLKKRHVVVTLAPKLGKPQKTVCILGVLQPAFAVYFLMYAHFIIDGRFKWNVKTFDKHLHLLGALLRF